MTTCTYLSLFFQANPFFSLQSSSRSRSPPMTQPNHTDTMTSGSFSSPSAPPTTSYIPSTYVTNSSSDSKRRRARDSHASSAESTEPPVSFNKEEFRRKLQELSGLLTRMENSSGAPTETMSPVSTSTVTPTRLAPRRDLQPLRGEDHGIHTWNRNVLASNSMSR